MPHMIVIMANPFIQIINIYFLVFFILRDPAKAERDLSSLSHSIYSVDFILSLL